MTCRHAALLLTRIREYLENIFVLITHLRLAIHLLFLLILLVHLSSSLFRTFCYVIPPPEEVTSMYGYYVSITFIYNFSVLLISLIAVTSLNDFYCHHWTPF